MNKTEKIIAALLGCFLAFLVVKDYRAAKDAATRKPVQKQQVQNTAQRQGATAEKKADAALQSATAPAYTPEVPEERVVLENGFVRLELTSHGAAAVKETLLHYGEKTGEIGEDNPPVTLVFSRHPLFAVDGVEGLPANLAWEVAEKTDTNAVFKSAFGTRTVSLGEDYTITLEEDFNDASPDGVYRLALGTMTLGASKNGVLAVDSKTAQTPEQKSKVMHYDEEEPLKSYLVAGVGGCGGCGAANSSAFPANGAVPVHGQQVWIALKNRFFVTALTDAGRHNTGFDTYIERDVNAKEYRTKSIAVSARFKGLESKRSFTVYAGPKEQSRLWDLGMKDVMEFGMWRWVCYPMVAILNFFHAIVPNYG
ncbi:MAG: membrane protein insertase YidC, partial [Kiritimatiellae bacterium]|nr:membrane protein insertase YidC [Kiritimatiellia bacterium]